MAGISLVTLAEIALALLKLLGYGASTFRDYEQRQAGAAENQVKANEEENVRIVAAANAGANADRLPTAEVAANDTNNLARPAPPSL